MWNRVLMIVATVGAVGCSKKPPHVSPEELVAKQRPRLEALAAKITKLAPLLPPDAEVAFPAKIDPPVVFNNSAGGDHKPGNSIILMFDALANPAAQDVAEIPPSDLGMSLLWLAHPPFDNGGSFEPMAATLELGAATRYAIVVRPQGEVPPKLIDAKTFKAGSATAHLYIYDLVTDKLIGAKKIVATTPEKISYTYSAEGGQNERAEQAMLDSLKDDRKAQLNKAMHALGDVKWGW